jgi:hypothetical protein
MNVYLSKEECSVKVPTGDSSTADLPKPRRRSGALQVLEHLLGVFAHDRDWWKYSPMQW